MKKRIFVAVILNNNIPSTPSSTAENEARLHVTLVVQNAGSGQTGNL
jgi:hypothetical protein